MKNFEFYFEGFHLDENQVQAGIKVLRGDPVDIAHALANFASESLKYHNQPQAAIIIINAFKKFMEINPDITQQVLDALIHQDGARVIIQAKQKDIFNVDPGSAYRKN